MRYSPKPKPPRSDAEMFFDVVMDGARKAGMPAFLIAFDANGWGNVAGCANAAGVPVEEFWLSIGKLIQNVAPPGEDTEDMVRLIRQGINDTKAKHERNGGDPRP